MKYLIVDLNIKLDGHQYGFMNNLQKYAGEHIPDKQFFFLTNRSSAFNLDSDYKNTEWLQISEEEQTRIDAKTKTISKAAVEWKIIDKYAKDLEIHRLILMYLDIYQLELGRNFTSYKISGIWFAPYSRIPTDSDNTSHSFKAKFNKFRKRIQMQWALSNKNLDQIFILNDEAMPDWLNGKKKRFFTLPDPYFNYDPLPDYNLKEKYGIPEENLIYLQFGYIDERKNTGNIIRAFQKMDEPLREKSTLLAVGKFKPGFKEELEKLNTGDTKFQMILRDEFVSDEEMESTFEQVDVILRMNVNFYGSSGVIGYAAKHDKPVIASNNGVMAEIVEKYGLGLLATPDNIRAISGLLSRFHTHPESRKIDGSLYRDTHDLDSFAATLLGAED